MQQPDAEELDGIDNLTLHEQHGCPVRESKTDGRVDQGVVCGADKTRRADPQCGKAT